MPKSVQFTWQFVCVTAENHREPAAPAVQSRPGRKGERGWSHSLASHYSAHCAFQGYPPNPELPARFQSDSGCFKPIQTKKNKKPRSIRKNRKMSICPFSIANCCQPIRSSRNGRKRFYGFCVNFTHGYGGRGQ
jgi:hypothetical protein